MSEKDVKEIHAKIEALPPDEKLELAANLWRYGKQVLALGVAERACAQMQAHVARDVLVAAPLLRER
ncbi:MAG: hypothetical protein AMXMBFR56_66190 [Polyangiaceae bacterium]